MNVLESDNCPCVFWRTVLMRVLVRVSERNSCPHEFGKTSHLGKA